MIMIIIVCRSLIIFVGKSPCDAIGGTLKNQMDDAVAFKPDFVIQEAKDIVDTIQKKGTSIRLSVIMDPSWLQLKLKKNIFPYLSITILLHCAMYYFRSTLRRASTLSSPRFQESCLH